jgi:hypothetical protein
MSNFPEHFELTFPLATITLDGSIVIIKMNAGHKITLEAVKEMYQRSNEELKGKRVAVMLDARSTPLISYPESVLKYAADNEHSHKEAAYAILIDGVGQKMMAGFYLSLNKPKTPTRVFTDYAEAMAWLREMFAAKS